MCSLLFCLANLYVNLEVSQPKFNAQYEEGYFCTDHYCKGPLTEVKLGMRVEISKHWELDYGFKHSSFVLEPNDKGQNIPFIKVEWRPFK